MIVAIGSARVLPGRREELIAAARVVVDLSRAEDGCQSYGFFTDICDEDTIVSLEIWCERTALDAHMTRPHTRRFLDLAASLVDGPPSVSFYEVADQG